MEEKVGRVVDESDRLDELGEAIFEDMLMRDCANLYEFNGVVAMRRASKIWFLVLGLFLFTAPFEKTVTAIVCGA